MWLSLNSPRPNAIYMNQKTRPLLVQIKAYCLFGATPSYEVMLGCWQWETWKYSFRASCIKMHIQQFSLTQIYLKMSFANWQPRFRVHGHWAISYTVCTRSYFLFKCPLWSLCDLFPISFLFASVALGQSCDSPSVCNNSECHVLVGTKPQRI